METKRQRVYMFESIKGIENEEASSIAGGRPPTQEQPKKKFIRIFKDEVSKDLWDSYCMGLGIDNGDEIESFRIYINSQSDIQVDLTNEEKRV